MIEAGMEPHSQTERHHLSRELKARARALGFEKVGIARAAELKTEGRRLREWLDHGYAATMRWMGRDAERRADPRTIFPGARSVVVVALNYYTPAKHAAPPQSGKVSRYAWGDDYHEVVAAKLRSLLEWIKTQDASAEGKVCVDIHPVMDKAWGVRAGLGWIGKHSNLI